MYVNKKIKWNTVTWYSILCVIILFVVVIGNTDWYTNDTQSELTIDQCEEVSSKVCYGSGAVFSTSVQRETVKGEITFNVWDLITDGETDKLGVEVRDSATSTFYIVTTTHSGRGADITDLRQKDFIDFVLSAIEEKLLSPKITE